jgi:hypothetical protein
MHADRFGEVAIGIGIAGDLLSQPGQQVEGIGVVGLFQRLPDLGEFQHQQAAAGAQHAAHLGQGLLLVRHVAQAEGDRDDVEVVVGEGQLLGVALRGGGQHALVEQAVAADREHGVVDVGEPDLAPACRRAWRRPDDRSAVPPATSSTRSPGRGAAISMANFFHSRCRPADIRSFIRSYLPATDRKHAGDALRFFLLVYRLETEMGLAHSLA